ncbi:unnamed protein product [Cylindrotheca closterium]|uniref:Transmembrane protein n=1 Tax=Cylindrotheca closterium TaxID=2856 RepID=A0AAD2FPR6_9STRA|nr:unnamed protein product [Cylindrotheca closterium]
MPLHEEEQATSLIASAKQQMSNGTAAKKKRRKKRRQNKREYRGIFSSSICDMFTSPARSKTDACALACCGIWLWERNQFLLHGKHPKKWTQRPLETALFLLLIATLVLASIDLESKALKICVIIIVAIGIWRLLEFEYSRSRFRKELAEEEFHRQNLIHNNATAEDAMVLEPGHAQRRLSPTATERTDIGQEEHLKQFLSLHWNEINRRHNLLNCVRNDTHVVVDDDNDEEYEDEDEEFDVDDEDNRDFCQRLWNCFANVLCNTCCMCWCVWCGMCAIAQEHRHLAKVLPNTPSLWQRDYITMQPWSEYFPSILALRNSENMSFWAHCKALSELSSKLLKACGIFLLFAILLTMFLPVQYEKWQLGIMFGALVEPIAILFLTYWYWNRLDVSLDAIVKYFSSGFFLCTSMVLVYEFLASMVASFAVVTYSFLGTLMLVLFGDVEIDNFEDVNMDEQSIFDVMAPPDMGGNTTTTTATDEAENTLKLPTAFVLTIAILGALLNAFGVAALVEETFKYLSFWMVEHPDMENNVSLVPLSADDERHQGENAGLLSAGSQPTTHSSVDPSAQSSSKHPISLESRGAAITVSMIAVAAGFACAENLLYIFVYTENDLAAETTTLILRALFPVHPLCAAIQSIAVVQRDIEKDRSVGVGRIIFAAFLLHGSFDFILMAYASVMRILKGDDESDTDEEAQTSMADWIVFGCSLLIPLMGLEFYFYYARKQTKRLVDLDTGRVSSSQQVGDEPPEVV